MFRALTFRRSESSSDEGITLETDELACESLWYK